MWLQTPRVRRPQQRETGGLGSQSVPLHTLCLEQPSLGSSWSHQCVRVVRARTMLPLCVKGSYRHGPLLTGRVLRWCLRAHPSPGMMPCGTWGHLCACPSSSSSRLICRVCTCQPDAIAVLLSPPHPGPPRPLFYPLHPRNASARLAAVFCPPAALAGWVASARPWVGGGVGQGKAGAGDQGEG